MASMSMCDVCKVVTTHDSAHYIKIYHEKANGSVGAVLVTNEVCPECFQKVTAFLKLDARYLEDDSKKYKEGDV